MDNYFVILEVVLFLIFIPLVYNITQAWDLSKLFKKGYTREIRVFIVLFILVFAYLSSHAIISILEMSYTIAN